MTQISGRQKIEPYYYKNKERVLLTSERFRDGGIVFAKVILSNGYLTYVNVADLIKY